jgi:hypothetical protein
VNLLALPTKPAGAAGEADDDTSEAELLLLLTKPDAAANKLNLLALLARR